MSNLKDLLSTIQSLRNIVYHDVSEVWLTRQRTEGRELRTGQANDVMLAFGGVGHALQDCVARGWPVARRADRAG